MDDATIAVVKQSMPQRAPHNANGARPLKFKDVATFEAKTQDYFDTVPVEQWTITGLALHLDTFRKVLMEYEARDEFSNAVKRAKQKIEMAYELSLRANGRSGDIFALKNFGWRDVQEVANTHEMVAPQAPQVAEDFQAYVNAKTLITDGTKAQD